MRDGSAAALLPEVIGDAPAFFIVDEAMADRIDALVDARLLAPDHANVVVVGRGEAVKSLGVAQKVYTQLAALHASRNTVVVGIGGGAVTDLAGFIASTWMRGVRLILVPTTLLSQVDAAIGGKTALNLEGTKNLVGTFYPAETVVVDADLLATLPPERWEEGMFEALKMGVIAADPELLDLVRSLSGSVGQDPALMQRLTALSARQKLAIIGDDLRDDLNQSRRMTLNFGHTLGHALEAREGLSHGHAVAIGMIAAARLSAELTGLAPERVADLTELVTRFGGATSYTGTERDAGQLADAIALDKKSTGRQQVKLVLLRDFGTPTIYAADRDVVRRLVDAVRVAPEG